jgi:hypothetical protein
MTENDIMYEGDGILRKPNTWDRIAEYERRARRMRAIHVAGLFNRLFDWPRTGRAFTRSPLDRAPGHWHA